MTDVWRREEWPLQRLHRPGSLLTHELKSRPIGSLIKICHSAEDYTEHTVKIVEFRPKTFIAQNISNGYMFEVFYADKACQPYDTGRWNPYNWVEFVPGQNKAKFSWQREGF